MFSWFFCYSSFWLVHPWKLTCPLKRDYFSREYIFQPLIFRGHVSFQGGTCFCFLWQLQKITWKHHQLGGCLDIIAAGKISLRTSSTGAQCLSHVFFFPLKPVEISPWHGANFVVWVLITEVGGTTNMSGPMLDAWKFSEILYSTSTMIIACCKIICGQNAIIIKYRSSYYTYIS